jgi:hypothetical protein
MGFFLNEADVEEGFIDKINKSFRMARGGTVVPTSLAFR